MTGLNRWVPRLIIAIAILHFAWAFLQPNTWGDIAGEGFFGTISDPAAADYDERDADAWFLMCGIGNLAMGTLTHLVVRTRGRVPVQTGVYFLVLGVATSLLFFPVNPGPLLIAVGVLAVIASQQARRPVENVSGVGR